MGSYCVKKMCSRFSDNEPGLSLRSKLYQVALKGGAIEEFAEWVRCMAARAEVELYAVEFFLK